MPESGKAPKVTLIMPAYNAAAYISASVRSVLDQSFRDWELIVVNDGSGDDTGRILATLSDGDARLFKKRFHQRFLLMRQDIGIFHAVNVEIRTQFRFRQQPEFVVGHQPVDFSVTEREIGARAVNLVVILQIADDVVFRQNVFQFLLNGLIGFVADSQNVHAVFL